MDRPARSARSRFAAARVDDSGNRGAPGAGITVSIVGGSCPCPSLWTQRDRSGCSRRRRSEPGRARPEVPQRRQRLRHRRPLLQEREQHRHAHRQPVDEHRHAAGHGDLRGRDAVGLAAGALRRAGRRSPRTRPTSCRITPTSATTRRRAAIFSSMGVDRAAAARADQRRRRRQRRLPLRHRRAFPTQTFNATNYWVDVVFDSTPDTTAPSIGDVVADAARRLDGGRHLDDERAVDLERRLLDRGDVPAGAARRPCRMRRS